MTVPISRPSRTAPGSTAEVALEVEERGAPAAAPRRPRRLADLLSLEGSLIKLARVERAGGLGGLLQIIEPVAGHAQRMGDRPIDQAGIQVPQAIMDRKPLAERAFAGGGRPVDGDDHVSSAPRARIMGTKLGKLVAMKDVSSTPTG